MQRTVALGLVGVVVAALSTSAGCSAADPDAPSEAPTAEAEVATDALSTQFVRSTKGSLPIVLSCPHGGSKRIPGAARASGETVLDAHTIEITEGVSRALEAELGAKPFVVIAEFSRKDLDVNRGPSEAYESDAARVEYEAYYGALRRHVDTIRARYGRGLLVDIHGQSENPATIYRGTRNGRCITSLLATHGVSALTGESSIFGDLERRGYGITPPNNGSPSSPRDEARYNGGNLVFTFGSQHDNGIDAVQLEIGKNYRAEERRAQTAVDIAGAIARFARAHLPERAR